MKARDLNVLACLCLAVVTISVFSKVLGHDFVDYDDDLYVTENSQVQEGLSWKGIHWAFTTFHASNWHPLTWLSHMLDCQFYGLNAGYHHLTNLAFHILNTLLLFGILKWTTGAFWPSVAVAALFAIHPLHAESVAWIAERKDVLSTFLWLLALWAYATYVKNRGVGRYLLTLLLFALGLMAKPMLVTLPFVLLLIDYWPLNRFGALPAASMSVANNRTETNDWYKNTRVFCLIWEKIPFFVLVAASSVVTFMAQQKGDAISSLESLPMDRRIGNALISYLAYIKKMFWPNDLVVFYSYRHDAFPSWQVLGAGLLLVLVTIVTARAGRRFPYLPFGWLWYVGTLVPVIGLVQVGSQAMADRYTYVPFIGLFVLISWGLSDLGARLPYRKIVLSLSAAALFGALSACTFRQLTCWRNGITLFTNAVKVSPDSEVVHNNLGVAFAKQGQYHEAINHYSKALGIRPHHLKARFNLGFALGKTGRVDEAIEHFSKLLQMKPDYAEAHYNIGVALTQKGQVRQAVEHYTDALRIKPDYPEAYNELGICFASQGKINEAIIQFSKALEIKPDFQNARNNLKRASALIRSGKST
jgi:Tfp pilus assembly protein PilF